MEKFYFKVNPFVFVLALLIFYDALSPYVVVVGVQYVNLFILILIQRQ
jgi:hypothetical protein